MISNVIGDYTNLRWYLVFKGLLAIGLSIVKLPLRGYRRLDYFSYRKDTKHSPHLYNPTERYIKSHWWVPKLFINFHHWSYLRGQGHRMQNIHIGPLVEKLNFLNALMWVYKNAYYKNRKLENIQNFAVHGKREFLEGPGDKLENYFPWMLGIPSFVDPSHPHIEALRYAFLAGDINQNEYLALFHRAREKDKSCTHRSYVQLRETAEVFLLDRPSRKIPYRRVNKKYKSLFGDQFELPLYYK